MQVGFSKTIIDANTLDMSKKLVLPFGSGCYEINILLSIINEKKIDINSLDRIRTNFIDNYFKKDDSKKFPNILFDFQKKIKEDGHIEAYNHWVLMKGDEENFSKWRSENQLKYDNFTTWFKTNKLSLSLQNRFYRNQY